jgi:hypothetical protein
MIKKFQIFEEINSDTIIVNGIERSKYNSLGKLIHPTNDGIINFWKWFGDSKVVDSNNRPLVVYHGTEAIFNVFKPSGKTGNYGEKDQIEGMYFTDNKTGASFFSLNDDSRYLKNIYLSIQNPFISEGIKELKESLKLENLSDVADKVKKVGYDGLIINRGFFAHGGPHKKIITFFPSQIKSATENQGTFDLSNPNILEQKIDYFLNSINEDLTTLEFKQKVLNFLPKLKTKEDIKLFLLRTVENLKLKKYLIFLLIKTILVLQLLTFSELISIFKDTQYNNIILQYKKYMKPKNEFIAKMFQRESSSRANIIKSDKHGVNVYIGGFQLSKRALKDLGININPHEFKKNPNIFPYKEQEKAFMAYIKKNEFYLRNHLNYIGKIINGIEITKSGLLAAAHLVGQKKVKLFLTSNGKQDYADGNGVKCSDYMSEFSGYDLD